jgi:hypothetical protein
MDYYELRDAAATMLLEGGVTPWDVAIQLGHREAGSSSWRSTGTQARQVLGRAF